MWLRNNPGALGVCASSLWRSGIPAQGGQHACQLLSGWNCSLPLLSRVVGNLAWAASYLGRQAQTHLWLLQELGNAEKAYRDVCDQIAKAERFFPLTGGARGEAVAHQQGKPCRGQYGHLGAFVESQLPAPDMHTCAVCTSCPAGIACGWGPACGMPVLLLWPLLLGITPLQCSHVARQAQGHIESVSQ